MKLFAILLLTFAMPAAFANCPNLTGTFQCSKDEQDPMDTGVVTVQMMQEGSDVLYVFTDNDNPSDQMVLPADGKIYQDGNYSYQGACKDNKLYTVEKGTDKEYGPYTINSVYSLNSNNSLDLDITISLQGQSIPFKEVCTRL